MKSSLKVVAESRTAIVIKTSTLVKRQKVRVEVVFCLASVAAAAQEATTNQPGTACLKNSKKFELTSFGKKQDVTTTNCDFKLVC